MISRVAFQSAFTNQFVNDKAIEVCTFNKRFEVMRGGIHNRVILGPILILTTTLGQFQTHALRQGYIT